jgi:hypothetical protein
MLPANNGVRIDANGKYLTPDVQRATCAIFSDLGIMF